MAATARVLVVQSKEAVAEATRWRLATDGYEAIIARDGDAAVRMVDLVAPHVVLVDLTLAVLDGWYVLSRFGENPDLPVIAYCPRASDEERALELGARVCIANVGDVIRALKTVVGTQHTS